MEANVTKQVEACTPASRPMGDEQYAKKRRVSQKCGSVKENRFTAKFQNAWK
jgi:hypothetical protein